MSTLLYVGPWVLWFLAFIALEVNGFRKGHDRWPTLSELVKRFEREGARDGTIVKHQSVGFTYMPLVKAGLVTWTWRRWLIAAGLPVLAVVLELHWVLEVF